MTNTTQSEPFAHVAATEYESRKRGWESRLEGQRKNNHAPSGAEARMTLVYWHRMVLAQVFHEEGLVRAVEMAVGYRDMLQQTPDRDEALEAGAMSRAGSQWLSNHLSEIQDVLLHGVGTDDMRYRLVELLIQG